MLTRSPVSISMPADLPTLQGRLDALKLAIANGRQSVSYAGRTTVYRSVADLQAAIKDVESDMAALNGTSVLRTYRFHSHKDL
jgi:hypothetical protein